MAIEPPRINASSGVLTQFGYKPCALPPRAVASDRIERTAGAWFATPNLAAIEGDGTGHTLRRHVGISDAALRARAEATGHDASSFPDARTAQLAVDRAFAGGQEQIAAWLARGTRQNLRLEARFDHSIGRVYRCHRDAFEPSALAFVILKRSGAFPQGYTVITAYPK